MCHDGSQERIHNSTLREGAIDKCAEGDGKIRRTWWWGPPSDIKARVLIGFDCKGGKPFVGVYYDDPLGAKQQVKRAKQDGTWPF